MLLGIRVRRRIRLYAESRSLAFLEVLVPTEDTRVLAAIKWVTIPVYIEESFIEIADPLPDDWRRLPAPPSTRELGSRWVAESTWKPDALSRRVMMGGDHDLLHADLWTGPSYRVHRKT